jgi:hypothetical protein
MGKSGNIQHGTSKIQHPIRARDARWMLGDGFWTLDVGSLFKRAMLERFR